MKIKENNPNFFSKTNVQVITGIVVVLGLLFYIQITKPQEFEFVSEKFDDIESTFVLDSKVLDLKSIVGSKNNRIYGDANVSIYAFQENGVPEILYVYKGELSQRQLEDKFFLHVFLRDNTFLLKPKPDGFINLDFNTKVNPPIMVKKDSIEFTVFKQQLTHYQYRESNIPLDNIKFINTGRFQSGTGRSLDIQNLKIVTERSKSVPQTTFKNITLAISEKSFKKIQAKRDEALKSTVLITGDDDFVKATVSTEDDSNLDAKIRLKGDWTDHLINEKKWSYRIILDGNQTLFGMRKLSVQDPRARHLAWEWLFNRVVKDEDIIGLRYGFASVTMEVKNRTIPIDMGIMAIEESFDKILIENNRRREGLIMAFDESMTWNERKQTRELKLKDGASWSYKLGSPNFSNIKVFNQNKVLSDPKLAKQLEIAKNLLDGLRKKTLTISEVFDLDKLTTFVALSNLFGGSHGLVAHNIRMYYNPITNKLEPLSFDSGSGEKLTKLYHYPFSGWDPAYSKMMAEKLEWVSSEHYINEMLNNQEDELSAIVQYLKGEFTFEFDKTILEYNANFIRKHLAPSDVVVTSLLDYKEGSMNISVQNLSEFFVEVDHLKHKDGKLLNTNSEVITLKSGEKRIITFKLDPSFANAFVSKKNKKGGFSYPKDVEKLRIHHRIVGIDKEYATEIAAFGIQENSGAKIASYQNSFVENFQDFDFISINKKRKEMTFQTGQHSIEKPLIIPSNYKIKVQPGFELDIKNNAYLFSNSTIDAIGTKEEPIKFYSSDSSGGGIFINKTLRESELRFCTFSNLSNPITELWELSGAVNFHEADVTIANCVFEKNRCEDGLNIIRSSFTMTNSMFRETKSDAFDGDFVVGTITDTTFNNAGNDGIDISGSRLTLKNITINNPSDKAISAGEASEINGETIFITGGEIGIVSKDLSAVTLDGVSIKDTQLAFSAFQKKTEFGTGNIAVTNLVLANNQTEFLIEQGSRMTVDGNATETVSNKVIDQMYGNEYGKSSK